MKLSDFSERRLEVFALYDKKESDVLEDIRILREWMSKLPHLPNDMIQDEFLELCLLKNKFSIEKSKSKIEMYCTLKGNPHYDYVYDRIPVPSKEPSSHIPIPMLTDEYKRLVFFTVNDVDAYEMDTDLNFNAVIREFLLRYDYNDGEIEILDLRNCPSSIIRKFRVNIYADSIQLILKCYSARISAIHVISKIGRTLFAVFMHLLPKKLVSRLHFHDDEESLRRVVPAKYLPSDLGGDLKSLQEIRADWDEIFVDNRKLIRSFVDTKSREELRQGGDSVNEELKGTFRKLNLD
ncbi:uncharacterized protein LOC123310046 [Coccinella septempunctata]|uniref:uncharacterized protein LOC123310046 n=1 Tax=Coccinella septempunctata TaxID=41139 RepID=UPI001D08382F|nr:uncharacterized protein LOC123310046 [Coccinella septempunctata]